MDRFEKVEKNFSEKTAEVNDCIDDAVASVENIRKQNVNSSNTQDEIKHEITVLDRLVREVKR